MGADPPVRQRNGIEASRRLVCPTACITDMASPACSLATAWGRRPCVLPPDWLDLSPVDTDLPSVERLLRRLDESRMRVRLPGDGPASGSPRRVALRDIPDLSSHLASGQPLHLQAIDLHQVDAGHAEMLRRFRQRLEALVPEVAHPSTQVTMGLFLSSGGAVAPFHADQEHNFLAQVAGDKKMHMFPSELDTFPCIKREALAADDEHVLDTYHPALEARAEVVHLVPGTTLYHPPMSPHWVDTGRASPSLSLTFSFTTPSVQRVLLLHKLNRRLRRLGLQPAPVGRRPGVDAAKLVVARAMRALVRLQRPG